jgi:predicted  nucleic acid-binding Zn-ribbon protein
MLSKDDLKEIQTIVQTETSNAVEKAIAPLKKDIKTLTSDVTQIRSDMKTLVNFFDKEYLELRKRVERIEEHLRLSPVAN